MYVRKVYDYILHTQMKIMSCIKVETDVCKFEKRKYHKGRRVDGVIVFGDIERDSRKCFFTTVENGKLMIPKSV